MKKVIDLVGQQFGRLLVKEFVGLIRHKAVWRCDCSCGQSCTKPSTDLRSGRIRSCGCLLREKSSARAIVRNQNQQGDDNRNFRHGHSGRKTPTYQAWSNMLTRTSNSNFHAERAYRNVSVCEQWETFEGFLADMGERPSPKHTLSRYLDMGNYEPGNVEWGTWADQRAEHRGKMAWLALHEHNQKMAFLEVLA